MFLSFCLRKNLRNLPELPPAVLEVTFAKKRTIYPNKFTEAICPTLYSRTYHKNKGFWLFACLHGVTKNICAQGMKNRQRAGNEETQLSSVMLFSGYSTTYRQKRRHLSSHP